MKKIIRWYKKIEHWLKLASSLYVIGTSIYDIREDLSSLKKEHGLLVIGLVMLGKTFYELYAKITELGKEYKEPSE